MKIAPSTGPNMREAVAKNSAAIVLLGVTLSACAAAMPGYVPEGSKRSAFDRVKSFDAGAVSDTGNYVPSAAERDLPCGKLRGSMMVIISRLKAGQKPEPSAAAAAAQSAAAGIRGKALILPPTEEARRERARLESYNGLLAEKKCPTIDISAELTASQPAPPTAPAAKQR